MDYSEFEKAVDMFGILTKVSRKDLKKKYLPTPMEGNAV